MASVLEEAAGRRGIEDQVVLPWSRTLQMTRENIFVRLGRSAITALGIFLGIAFLSVVLFGAAVSQVKAQMDLQQYGVDHASREMQARIVWLAAMSLLVATVGIVNSMLTAVTERYKEIGTMKCLGALDSFIVRLFVLEAGLLGILGSASGAVVGTLLVMLTSVRAIGWSGVMQCWTITVMETGRIWIPFAGRVTIPISLWLGLVLGIVMGGLLSVVAALYPAWRAAKMPPAAALRSEF